METTVRTIIEQPFPEALIRVRKGRFGKQLVYVETAHYVNRLNDAFAGDWSFEIVEKDILENEVIVLGKLIAGEVQKNAFGTSAITTSRESGEPVSLGDDLKAAASDALKKCSSWLGLGLHLYGLESTDCESADQTSKTVAFPGADSNSEAASTLTNRQYGAILALGEKAGYSESQVKTRVLDLYSLPLDKLDRRTASELISELNSKVNGNGKAVGGAI